MIGPPTRIPIAFEPAYAILLRSVLVPPSDSYLEIDEGDVSVKMVVAALTGSRAA